MANTNTVLRARIIYIPALAGVKPKEIAEVNVTR